MLKRVLTASYRFLVKHLSGKGLTRIPIFKFINQNIINHFKNTGLRKIEFRGHTLFLDPQDSLNLSFSDYEVYETELIEKELKEGDIFIDIGANIGYHTLTAAKKVGRKGKIYAFEPEPKNFSLLTKNVAANNYSDRCVLICKGVSKKTGREKLYLDPFNYGGHALFDHFQKPEVFLGARAPKTSEGSNFIEIEVVSIDDFLGNNKVVNVIKMDIEGAEALAIEGMLETLRANDHLAVFSEFSPVSMAMLDSNPEKFLETFAGLGFEVFSLNERRKTLTKTSIKEILKDCTVENSKTTNLLFKKQCEP